MWWNLRQTITKIMLSLSFLRYFQKILWYGECLNEKRKFCKVEYSEYRIIPFYDHLHLENYMLCNSLLKLINFHGFVYTNFRFNLKIIF